ncbi:MAG: hypothetical protein U0836_07915 [Pirellulales bacterium]
MPRESRPYWAAFWACWMLAAIYDLLYYQRFRMVVDGSRLAIEKPFRSYEMDLAQVNRARWQHVPTLLKLKEGRNSLRLDLSQFRLEDRLPLIELFREAIPRNAQQGWDVFCRRVALSLRQVGAEDVQDRPLEADEVLVTRRRFDRLFLCMLPAVAVVAGLAAWYSHSWFLFFWSLSSIGLIWAPLRFMFPQKGYRAPRITRRRDRSYFGFLLGALVVGLAGIWLSFAFNAPPAITWGGAGLWILAVLWRAGLEGQRRTAELEQAALGADAEWNRLLAAGTAELPK